MATPKTLTPTPVSPTTSTTSTSTIGAGSFALWAIAWLVLIAILWGFSRTKWGHVIVSYTLWLLVILVFVTHWAVLQELFTAGNPFQGQTTV